MITGISFLCLNSRDREHLVIAKAARRVAEDLLRASGFERESFVNRGPRNMHAYVREMPPKKSWNDNSFKFGTKGGWK